MKFARTRSAATLLAGATLLLGLAVSASPASAAAPAPWEPDPSAVGTISFYDANGVQIYGGSTTGTAPFAKYAVGSAYPRSGDKFSELQFANPQAGITPDNWFVEDATGGTTLPYTGGPAPIAALGATRPVSVGSPDDQTLDGFEADSAIDPTPGYKNVIQMRLRTANANGTPTLTYDSADIQIDTATHSWTQIYPAAPVTGGAAGTFTPLSPARVLDTRASSAVAAKGTRTLAILGQGGVPAADVSAVVLNVTVTAPTANGYLTVYGAAPQPGVSNLNFVKGQTVPNLVIAPVDSAGNVRFYNGSAGTVQVVADVSGYYLGGTPTVPGALKSLTPSRVLDTRTSSAVAANATRELSILGHGGLPSSGVSAVVLNVTVTKPTKNGYLTVYGSGTRPTASNLNFVTGQTVPNLVVAPVGSDGKVRFFNGSPGTVQVVADVSGYFLAGTPTDPGAFVSLTPARLTDTRKTTPVSNLGPKAVLHLPVAGQGGVPAGGVSAVQLNVTVAAPTAGGYVTAYGDTTTPRPTTSNVNFVKGQVVPNAVVTPIGTNGKVAFYNGSVGTTPLVVDVSGYYLSGPA